MYFHCSRGQKLVSVVRFFEPSAFDPTDQYHWPLPRGNTCVILSSPMRMSRRIRTWTSIFNNHININNIRPLSSGNICIILTSPMMMSWRRSTRTWTSATSNHCPEKYGEISSERDRSSLCDIEKSSFKCFEIGLKMILPTQVHTKRITKTLLGHLPDL